MDSVLFLIPLSLLLGFLWVLVFLWSLDRNQYTDLEGASQRLLYDEDKPLKKTKVTSATEPIEETAEDCSVRATNEER